MTWGPGFWTWIKNDKILRAFIPFCLRSGPILQQCPSTGHEPPRLWALLRSWKTCRGPWSILSVCIASARRTSKDMAHLLQTRETRPGCKACWVSSSGKGYIHGHNSPSFRRTTIYRNKVHASFARTMTQGNGDFKDIGQDKGGKTHTQNTRDESRRLGVLGNSCNSCSTKK